MLSDIAGSCAAVLLAAIGVLHVVWAWSPWPARDQAVLGDHVYGGPGLPGRGPCLVVGVGLLAGAYCVLVALRPALEVVPHPVYRVGIWVLTGLLLARGLAGPLFSLRGSATFRRWNLIAYTPLCLALGLGVLAAAAL